MPSRDLSFSVSVQGGDIRLDVEAQVDTPSGLMAIRRVCIDGRSLHKPEWLRWGDEIEDAGWEAFDRAGASLDPDGDADRRYDAAEDARRDAEIEDAIRQSREQNP